MDIDDDMPLADHPLKREPKAGDADRNRDRDAKHYAHNHPGYALDSSRPETPKRQSSPDPSFSAIPDDAPVKVAWRAYLVSTAGGAEPTPWSLFLAGWTARDQTP